MDPALEHELQHHEELYSGFAQQHFAKPAVRAFRRYLVGRILKATGATRESRVLSLGCGIGDTESMLAPHVASIHGFDLSPKGIEEAQRNAAPNTTYEVASMDDFKPRGEPYDAAIGIFFLHHMAADLPRALKQVRAWVRPGGVLYAIDPSRYRLSGMVGRLLIPGLMKRYQTDDEEPLSKRDADAALRDAGWRGEAGYFDFVSTPLAGLFPSWEKGYAASRAIDHVLIRTPLLRALASNLEIVARRG